MLFIGIVNYLYDQHAVSHVTVEVDDVVWMDQWIKRHQYLLPMAVVCVKIPQGIGKLWSATKSFF